MLRQALISLVVLAVAVVGWVVLVPGARETLSGMGIAVPFGASAKAVAGKPAAGGGHAGGGAGFSRATIVVTAPVAMATINNRLNALGDAKAEQSVTVVAQDSGQITAILVAAGQQVKAGEVLVQLDKQAQAIDLDKAKLAAQDAADTLTRTQALAKSSSASTVQVASAQLANANAQLALKTAQLAYDKRSITAPIDGVVGLFKVNAGDYVTAQTAVTTIDDLRSLQVDFSVPERFISQLKVGMPVTATASALPGQPIAGTIKAIDNQVDPASRTLLVEASIPNESGLLRSGMSLSVTLDFKGEQFPAVDPLAVQWSADGSYVWQYVDGKVKKVMASIIERNNDGVLVKGPLKPGDSVVTQGLEQLRDGESVRLLEASDTGGPGAGPAKATS